VRRIRALVHMMQHHPIRYETDLGSTVRRL